MLNDSPAPPISEAEIIRRAQKGDVEAFGILFQKHKTRVYALCLRMTRNTAEAERSHPGCLPPCFSQAVSLPRQLRPVNLALSCHCQHRTHAFSEEIAGHGFGR